MQLLPLSPPDGAVLVPMDRLEEIAAWVKTETARLWRDGSRAWVTHASAPRPAILASAAPLDPDTIHGVTLWKVARVNGLTFTTASRAPYTLRPVALRKVYRTAFRFRQHPVRHWVFDRATGTGDLYVALRFVPLASTSWL